MITKKAFTNILRFNIFMITAFSLSSCKKNASEDQQYTKLKKYIKAEYGFNIPKTAEQVYIISESATECGTCNKVFSEYVKQNIHDKNSYIFIDSRGSMVDIDNFYKRKDLNKNVFIKTDLANIPKDIAIPNLGIVHLKNKTIDSVTYINPRNIQEITE